MFENKKKTALIVSAAFTLITILFCMMQPLYSGDIDNYGMALVANKLFAGEKQDGYIIFLHPILCKIFEVIHKLLPQADCFSLIGELCIIAGVWWISYYMLLKARTKWEIAFGYGIILLFILLDDLFHANFTRWAVFLCVVGTITWILSLQTQERKYQWIGVAFLVLGGLWRNVVAFLLVPFVGVVLLTYILNANKDERKNVLYNTIKSLLLPCLCVLLLFGSQKFVDQTPKYRYAKEFNDACSVVLDYPVYDYFLVGDKLSSVSYNDYYFIQNWFMADTDYVNLDKIKEIGSISSSVSYRLKMENARIILWRVKDLIIHSSHLVILSCICICLGLLTVWNGNKWQRIGTCLLFAGTVALLIILVAKGRAIERSFYPPLYCLFSGLVGLYYSERLALSTFSNAIGKYILLGIMVLTLGYEISKAKIAIGQSVWNVYDTEPSSEQEELRIWSCSSWANAFVKEQYMDRGKLIPLSVMQKNITEGNWFYGQVYFNQYLSQIGTYNPIMLLLDGDAEYMSEDPSQLLQYLREHYNENIDLEREEKIHNIDAWKVVVGE